MVNKEIFNAMQEDAKKRAGQCPEKNGSEQFIHPDYPSTIMCSITVRLESPKAPRSKVEVKCKYLGPEEFRVLPDDPKTKIFYCPCYLQKK